MPHRRVPRSLFAQSMALTLLLLFTQSDGFAEQPLPHWVWSDNDRIGEQSCSLTTTINLSQPVDHVHLRCAADFCRVQIDVDESTLLTIEPYAPLVERTIPIRLPKGKHKITLQCNGVAGPSTVAANLRFIASQHVIKEVATDEQWGDAKSFGTVAPQLWGIDARPVTISPFDDYEQWRDASTDSEAESLPPFQLVDGFAIERVRQAQADEGSWVSLVFDPQGRLIVAREDKGLLRMTLAEEGGRVTKVETINDTLEECRGLAFVGDDLLANANNSKGLYRLRDTTGDDQFDDVTLLRQFPGGVGHGRNDIAVGTDDRLYSIHGDAVDLPTEEIVDRTSPFRDARRGIKTNEGALLRATTDGKQWELICAGLRNPFGIAVHPQHNEPFTYDADAEHDMGAPWYRPTRVVHLVSGADYGWRGVTGQWPPYFPDRADNALPVSDIGKGSPTAVKFGTRSSFPTRYKEALFILDWAYGRIIAVHLDPHGAGYRAQAEVFARGRPLNVTDLDFGPDGAMYVITGGRKTQSALYRIAAMKDEGDMLRRAGGARHSSSSSPQQQARQEWSQQARARRRQIEAHHQPGDASIIDAVWDGLDDADPTIRHAARIAIEHQPLAHWQQRVLKEVRPQAQLTGLLALARSGDVALFDEILRRLNEIDLTSLDVTQTLTALRVDVLCLKQLERIDATLRDACRQKLSAAYPLEMADVVTPVGMEADANHELARLLIRLGHEAVVAKTMRHLRRLPTAEARLPGLFLLREARVGWTPADRRAWFVMLGDAQSLQGGRGLPGFLETMRTDAVATLSDEQRAELADVIEPPSVHGDEAPLPQREHVRKWTMEEFQPSLAEFKQEKQQRDFERGREMYRAALCSRCHRVGVEGSAIGPDLTSVGSRFSPHDVLQSIIKPSLVVAEPYRTLEIVTTDGRALHGQVLTTGDYRARTLTVIVDPLKPSKTIEINKSDIDTHRASTVSPMPAGLLETLSHDEVLDLLAYLASGGDASHPLFHQ